MPVKRYKYERELKEIWGDEFINQYKSWIFEYATKEASFLQLRESCNSDLHYKASFSSLCRLRTQEFLIQLMDTTKSLSEITNISYSELRKKFRLYAQKPGKDSIEALIHQKYHPNSFKSNPT